MLVLAFLQYGDHRTTSSKRNFFDKKLGYFGPEKLVQPKKLTLTPESLKKLKCLTLQVIFSTDFFGSDF